MTTQIELAVKATLTAAALAVVVWRHLKRRQLPAEQAGRPLWAMAVLALAAWANFGLFHGGGLVHHWEMFHYFLGSKYFPELRYDGLYVASLAAQYDADLGLLPQSHLRDLRDNRVRPVAELQAHGAEVKARFSPRRWRRFVSDTAYFLRHNSYDYVIRWRLDHGYNPTPAWTAAARALTAPMPATASSLRLLALIDPILLGVLFVAVFRTFGPRTGCLTVILFGLGFAWRFDWVGGALLRHGWLTAVGLAACALRSRRPATSGALLATAAALRIFPAAFLLGPAVVLVRQRVQGRPTAWARRLVAGFVVGLAAWVVAGSLTGAGWQAWRAAADNLQLHRQTRLTNNVGLGNVVLYDREAVSGRHVDPSRPEPWERWQRHLDRRAEDLHPVLLAASAAMLAIIAAAAWRQRPEEAAVLGTATVFALAAPTCYYWVMLCLVPLGPGRWRPTAALLGVNLGLYGLALTGASFEVVFGAMSWALAVLFVAWLGPDAWQTLRARGVA